MIYRGSCLCQTIQFQFEAKDPLPFGHCHCGACRKSHGADSTSATIIPAQRLQILEGEESLAVYQSSANMQRQFCRQCGSRLFVRFERNIDNGKEIYFTVAINVLDNLERWQETAHIFVGHKAPWNIIKDGLPQAKDNFPPK